MIAPTEPAGPDDLAELRRRLYQPSASDDDVRRYRAAVAATAPPPPVAPVRRDRRTLAVRVAVPAGVAATALVLGAIVATSRPVSTPSPTPDPPSTVGLTAQGTTSGPYSFQQAADSTEPLSLTTMITESGVSSYTAVGPGTITLDRSTLSSHGGVIRVAMLTATADAVGWQIDRLETRADLTSHDRTLARGSAAQEMAPVTPVQFEYRGAPPTTIEVHAPVGTRWWLDLRLAQRS